jgi:hypothetical protein
MADSTTSAGSVQAQQESNGDKTAAGGGGFFTFDGMTFTLTERNVVAQVGKCALGTESFFDAGKGTREHFVDVQGKAEAVLLLVSVNEDQRRIVAIRRFS